ncbi:MAG: hypothetical protein IJ457_03130 [Clostridia bacterium]|nr:hypothetical protein [Clostridia bacterium]
MKRLFLISFAVFLVLIAVVSLVLWGLDKEDDKITSDGETSGFDESFSVSDTSAPEPPRDSIYEKGENHTVELRYNEEGLMCGFIAKVYSDAGELLGEDSSRTGCHVEYQNIDGEKVVCVWWGTGTGVSARWVRFYRPSDGKVSEKIQWYLDSGNGLVAFGKLDGVWVRDIFDDDVYSEKIDTFSIPHATDFLEPFTNAVLSDDGKSIEITYRIKHEDGTYGTNTETFELNR